MASEFFQKQQLKKRTEFHERVHAAFVLSTSLSEFGKLNDDQLSWLGSTYPNSEIKMGTDQGASYYTVLPKF